MSDEWRAIHDRLRELDRRMPQLKAEYPAPGDFFPAFAGIADEIREAAERVSVDAADSASILLHNMLVEHGWLPESPLET